MQCSTQYQLSKEPLQNLLGAEIIAVRKALAKLDSIIINYHPKHLAQGCGIFLGNMLFWEGKVKKKERKKLDSLQPFNFFFSEKCVSTRNAAKVNVHSTVKLKV